MHKDLLIKSSLTVIGVLFNIYGANVITKYNSRPKEYYKKCYGSNCGSQEAADDDAQYEANALIRRNKKYNRDVTLLTFGVIMLILAMFTPNHSIKVGLGLAGLLTIFYSAIINWNTFDDRYRLFIVALALAALCYISIKFYNGVKN